MAYNSWNNDFFFIFDICRSIAVFFHYSFKWLFKIAYKYFWTSQFYRPIGNHHLWSSFFYASEKILWHDRFATGFYVYSIIFYDWHPFLSTPKKSKFENVLKRDFFKGYSIRKRFTVWKNSRQLGRFCDRTLTKRHVMLKIFCDMWCEKKRVTCDMKWETDMWYEMRNWHVMWKIRHVMWNQWHVTWNKRHVIWNAKRPLTHSDRLFSATVYLWWPISDMCKVFNLSLNKKHTRRNLNLSQIE